MNRIDPEGAAYNEQLALDLTGALDLGVLRKSISEIVQRHEPFRTTFDASGPSGALRAIVHEQGSPVIATVDGPAADRAAFLEATIASEKRRPFDLATGPVLRVTVVVWPASAFTLLFTSHHIASDGWSVAVFVQDLMAIYEALHGGIAPNLPSLAIQYSDYAEWQRASEATPMFAEQVDYWTRALSDAPTRLDLPTDRQRPRFRTSNGTRFTVDVPEPTVERLGALCREVEATAFMGYLAAFALLVARYTARTDLVIGSVGAGRSIGGHNALELQPLIGNFANPIALRLKSTHRNFSDLLRATRAACLEAFARQDVPFESVARQWQRDPDSSRPPLQIMFFVNNYPARTLTLAGLGVRPVELPNPTAKCELSLEIAVRPTGTFATIEYNVDLFDRASMEDFGNHYLALLGQLSASPTRTLASFELLTSDAKARALADSRGATCDDEDSSPDAPSVDQMISDQARSSPERVAVIADEDELSYGDLSVRRNRVARALRASGIVPGDLIGVAMDRGIDMIAVLLGILRVGAAYVPMEPTWPLREIAIIARDTRPRLIVFQPHLLHLLPEGIHVVCADDLLAELAANDASEDSAVAPPPDAAFCIVTTSGSTGEPNNLIVTHRAVARRIAWNAAIVPFEEDAVACQKFPLSAVDSIAEIFAPLSVGVPLVLVPADAVVDIDAFVATLSDNHVTRVVLLPSLLRVILELPNVALRLAGVTTWISTGEALPPDLARRFFQIFAVRSLFNLYGTAEVGADCASHRLAPDVPFRSELGRPVPGMRCYVLDAEGHLVPGGAAGELHVAGEQVARGYLGKAALTADRFVPDPFAPTPGARMFRTGDLVQRRRDGDLVFLGRLDHQVKVRGIRVALSHIETALMQDDRLASAVATASGDESTDSTLVVYVVPRDEAVDVTPTSVRERLATVLPESILPAAVVVLDALPRTTNGKVDRRRLPRPFSENIHQPPPEGDIELALATIWRELLGVERVPRSAHFFEMGGHSLMANQVVSRVRATLGVAIPLAAVFEAPRLDQLARHIEERLARAPTESEAEDVIARVAGEGPFPVTSAQQRLWFLYRFQPTSSMYNLAAALRLEGELDTRALDSAMSYLQARHDALRTTFGETDGQPHQCVHPATPLVLSRSRVDGSTHADRLIAARAIAHDESLNPFDIERGPCWRVRLLELGLLDHVLLFTIHHIISDGWSIATLIEEVGVAYRSFARGDIPALAPPPIRYVDYASWASARERSAMTEAEVDEWVESLRGAPGHVELPTDRPRPAEQSYAGASVAFDIKRPLADAIEALSRGNGATLFMTTLSAFYVLLAKYTHQRDLVVGIPVANRARKELEKIVGMLVNTVALRATVTGSFTALLARVRDATLAAFARAGTPFERIVERLAPERDLSRAPIYQVMFAVQNTPSSELHLGGVRWSVLEDTSVSAKYDLTLSLSPALEGVFARIEYNRDLFDETTIVRLAEQYVQLLTAIVARPSCDVAELDVLTPHERHWMLETWNATRAPYDVLDTVHRLFEQQVDRTPAAIAARIGARSITYAELDRRANRLAHRLQREGAGVGTPVGACMERSIELVVTLLGIAKAGAAYVPLDPDYPHERLAFMFDDARAPVLVTDEKNADTIRVSRAKVVLDEHGTALADESDARLVVHCPLDAPLYVIYTSGTTGNPKGAITTHRSVVNHLLWRQEIVNLSPGTHVLQRTPHSFDGSVWYFFAPLLWGGTIVMAEPGRHWDPAHLFELITTYGVTVLEAGPTFLRALLASEGFERCTSLAHVFMGGEPLTRDLLDAYYATGGRAELHNSYGPTEATIVATEWSYRHGEPIGPIRIGRPIRNVQAYVLDGLNLVPLGVAGELVIGGDGVGTGYVHRPELTALRFIPDPFSSVPGARMYRSGDVVRLRSDAALEYIGRVDNQVKLRGFRIELGEIAAHLLNVAGVREAAVVVHEPRNGEKYLLAYVALDAEVSPADLLSHLQARLPTYMIPSRILCVERLPTGPSGKLDLRSLPAPDSGDDDARGYVAPATEMEKRLAPIWAELLGVARVGRHRSFFELGGHSLLAMRLVARIRSALGFAPSLRAIFESPTLSGFAQYVEGLASPPAPRARLTRGDDAEFAVEVPLSFGQERMWFLAELQPGDLSYVIPFIARVKGKLDVRALERSLAEVVRRHETLRTVIRLRGGRPVGFINDVAQGSALDLRAIEGNDSEQRLRALIDEALTTPFDLMRGPTWRAVLIRLHDDEHVLLLTMHHAIADGWSMKVLTTEIALSYAALLRGESPQLPELPVRYRDYARWQRTLLADGELDAQLDYWRARLAGLAPLDLPLDKPRPAVRTGAGRNHVFSVSSTVLGALQRVADAHSATIYMVLLAAFDVLLFRYSGSSDIAVGTPIANRRHEEVEDLIGFFVNTLVMRIEVRGREGFAALLARVRVHALEAYTHQDIPFDRLVQELAPDRDMSRTPLTQVMFVFQNGPPAALELPGVRFEGVAFETYTAKADLTLTLGEASSGLWGALEYSTDLFAHETITRMAEHFGRILEIVASAPDSHIEAIDILTAEARQKIVREWNATTTPTTERTVYELFLDCAARTPDAIALDVGAEQWTYRRLAERSAELGRELTAAGVGPEVVVGICLERSGELVLAVLSVLAAGGAFLPLDPSHPRDRLELMLDDSGCDIVLLQSTLRSVLLPDGRRRILEVVRSGPGSPHDQSVRSLDHVRVLPAQLAYVIYTSGSTGRPKGVAVAHRGLTNLVIAQQSAFLVGPDDRVLQFASVGFDASVSEMFVSLCAGATLCIAPAEDLRPGVDLARVMRERRITQATLPPTVLERLSPEEAPHAHTIVAAGEACPSRVIDAWSPERRFVNAYGPTEGTVCASWTECPSGVLHTSIGRPLDNTQMYVLSASRDVVPVGIAGEIAIAGVQLARGYVRRPDLTAQSFVPNPFSPAPGARMYLTGDRGRYREDGSIEYLGRADSQIKIRGHRIEPGEVEAALVEHPDVTAATVLVRERQPGDRRLAAYFVTRPGGSVPTDHELRNHLQRSLPAYMIPATFVVIEALPLTSSGKVDKRALLAASGTAVPSAAAYLPPATPGEAALCRIWGEVLGLAADSVSVTANFFHLGGNSMLAIDVVARATAADIPISIRSLFLRPTIAELLRDPSYVHPASISFALQPDGDQPALFCVHPLSGLPFCYGPLAHHLGRSQPVYGFRAPGLEGGALPWSSVEALAALYVTEVTRIQPRGPYRLLGWSAGGAIAIEMAQQLATRGADVGQVVVLDCAAPGRWTVEVERDLTAYDAYLGEMVSALAAGRTLRVDDLRRIDSHPLLDDVLVAALGVGVEGALGETDLAILRVARALTEALARYQPAPYEGEVLFVKAAMNAEWSREERDETGWSRSCSHLVVEAYACQHEELLLEPLVGAVAERILSHRRQTLHDPPSTAPDECQ